MPDVPVDDGPAIEQASPTMLLLLGLLTVLRRWGGVYICRTHLLGPLRRLFARPPIATARPIGISGDRRYSIKTALEIDRDVLRTYCHECGRCDLKDQEI